MDARRDDYDLDAVIEQWRQFRNAKFGALELDGRRLTVRARGATRSTPPMCTGVLTAPKTLRMRLDDGRPYIWRSFVLGQRVGEGCDDFRYVGISNPPAMTHMPDPTEPALFHFRHSATTRSAIVADTRPMGWWPTVRRPTLSAGELAVFYAARLETSLRLMPLRR